jgi:hypothetical protein
MTRANNKKEEPKKSEESLTSDEEKEKLLAGGTKALSGCLRFFLVGIFVIIVACFLFLIFRYH